MAEDKAITSSTDGSTELLFDNWNLIIEQILL
jgi:hypothetical protein